LFALDGGTSPHKELPRLFSHCRSDFAAIVDKGERHVIAWHRKAQNRDPLSLPIDVSEWNEWQHR